MPPASPRSASAGGWMPRTTERRSSRAVDRGLPGLAQQRGGGLGIGGHQLLGQADVHADRGDPGLGAVVQVALDPAYLGGAVVQGLGARRPTPPRPGARAARPGRRRGCCARPPPGRAPVPGVTQPPDDQQRTDDQQSSHHQTPPSTSSADQVDDRRDQQQRPAHRQHESTGRREPQEAEVAPARLVASASAAAGSPAGARPCRRSRRDLLAEQRAADPAVQRGRAARWPARRHGRSAKPTPSGAERHGQDREDGEHQRRHEEQDVAPRDRAQPEPVDERTLVDRPRADRTDRRHLSERAGHRGPVCHRPRRHGCGTGAVRRTAERAASERQRDRAGDHQRAAATAARRGPRPRAGRSPNGTIVASEASVPEDARRRRRRSPASASTERLDLLRAWRRAATAGAARPGGGRRRQRRS